MQQNFLNQYKFRYRMTCKIGQRSRVSLMRCRITRICRKVPKNTKTKRRVSKRLSRFAVMNALCYPQSLTLSFLTGPEIEYDYGGVFALRAKYLGSHSLHPSYLDCGTCGSSGGTYDCFVMLLHCKSSDYAKIFLL